jgi:hypothetical protein
VRTFAETGRFITREQTHDLDPRTAAIIYTFDRVRQFGDFVYSLWVT